MNDAPKLKFDTDFKGQTRVEQESLNNAILYLYHNDVVFHRLVKELTARGMDGQEVLICSLYLALARPGQ